MFQERAARDAAASAKMRSRLTSQQVAEDPVNETVIPVLLFACNRSVPSCFKISSNFKCRGSFSMGILCLKKKMNFI